MENSTNGSETFNGNSTNTNRGAPSNLPKTISCIILVLLIVLALFGNILVWVAFITVKRLQKVTNYYIVSLATADLLVASFAMPTWLLHMVFSGSVLIDGSVVYYLYLIFDIACGTASIINLTFVSCDRYLAIIRPFSYQALLSPPRVLGSIAFSWLFAILVAALRFVEAIGKKNYTIFVATTSLFIPTAIMVFTYSCIFIVARRHVRVINVISGHHQQKRFSFVTEMKAAKVIGVVIGGFLICWAPFLLSNLVLVHCVSCQKTFPFTAVYVLKLLQYASSAINPYVYTCLNADFRAAVKRLICRSHFRVPDISFSRSGAPSDEQTNSLRILKFTGNKQNHLEPERSGVELSI